MRRDEELRQPKLRPLISSLKVPALTEVEFHNKISSEFILWLKRNLRENDFRWRDGHELIVKSKIGALLCSETFWFVNICRTGNIQLDLFNILKSIYVIPLSDKIAVKITQFYFY